MNVTTTKEVDVDLTLDTVLDTQGRRVPVEKFDTDNDGDIVIDLGVRMPTAEENRILDYLELRDINLARLQQQFEEAPF